MKIVKFSDKYALLDNNGYILHTEKKADKMLDFVFTEFTCSARRGISYDESAIYADERGFYMTESELLQYWQCEADHEDYPRFSEYLRECCGKNGSLTKCV